MGERVDQIPLAQEAVFDAATKGITPEAFNFIAGIQKSVPGCGRLVGVEAGFVEKFFIVFNAKADRVKANPVLLTIKDTHRGCPRIFEHIIRDQAIEGRNVAQPDIFHVVNAVEQKLDIRHIAGCRCGSELRYDLIGVH